MEDIYSLLKFNSFAPLGNSRRLINLLIAYGCWLFIGTALYAEGTKQLAPNPDEIVMLLVDNDVYGNFAAYDGPENSRFYFRIKDAEEVVYIGLSRNFRANGQPESSGSYSYRIRRRSDGAVVHGPFTIHSFNENVSNWEDATLGPAAITGEGYETTDSRFFFNPDQAGDYFIEFDNAEHIGFWDVTVANGTEVQPGRIFSTNWAFRTPADQNETPECVWDREFNGILYSYTSDGFVTKIDFSNSGFQGLSFNVAFNRTGPGTSGDPQLDRMSVEGENLTENSAEHLIFLNTPDVTLFPDGECGTASVAESFLCTDDGGYCLEATVTQPGQVEIVLDFNQNGAFDLGLDVRLLEIFEDPGNSTRCIAWDGIKGDGTRPANGETVNLLVQYTQGVQHWALFDGEFLKNGFCVEPVRPICDNGQSNLLYWDDRNISDDPGTGTVKDGRLGCDCNEESCRTWNYFDPNTDDCRFINDNITLGYGDKSTLNTWWFARNVFTTYVGIPFPAGVTIEAETEICENETTTLTAVTDGADVVSVTWEGPDGIISEGGPDNTQITVSVAGTYAVFVVDANGCSSEATHVLTVIVCPVDLELDKLVDELNPEIGQTLNYEIAITNKGPGLATGIRVDDRLPDGLTDVTAISDGGVLESNVIVWENLSLEAGETLVLSYRAVVGLGQSYTNLAEITNMDQEDVDSTPGNGVDTNNNGEVVDDPGDEDDGDGVVVTPQGCSLTASIGAIQCDDNGTPVDPSDDTFTFELTINAENTSDTWVANDPGLSTGAYGESVRFGPYPISGGTVSFQIQDQFFGGECSIPISISPPATCSDQCLIETTVTNLLCNDSGTPSDPDDDTYTFDLTVNGFNTGESWSTGSVSAAYGETVSFGPIAISDGATNLTIVDITDTGCTAEVIVQAPATCSGQCTIEATIDNIICDDNGTPSQPEDDVYFFDILVEGANVSTEGWTTDLGLEGNYGEVLIAGPYAIADGNINLVFEDKADADCTTSALVEAPATCSDECLIEAALSALRCDNNGTLSDPEDDIFYFELNVSGLNTGEGWTSNLGISGDYDTPVSFGPYAISDGPFELLISDNEDDGCSITLSVTPPVTCSSVCVLEASIDNIICDDNGTPSQPEDDVYFFEILVEGANVSAEGWTSDLGLEGRYGEVLTAGPYPITDGNINLVFEDKADPSCTTSALVEAPATCSDECLIEAALSALRCDNNGTLSDPEDDIFYFELTVSGLNTGEGWTSNLGISGDYDTPVSFGPYAISDGPFELVISDNEDDGCEVTLSVTPPATCSNVCLLEASIESIYCDDNGTSSNPADDVYYADLIITGANASEDGFTIGGQNGQYGELITVGPFPIAEGNVSLDINDASDAECRTTVDLTAPAETCSDDCEILVEVLDVICDDNGTPSVSEDDVFTIEVIVNGFNYSDRWQSAEGTVGNYEEVTTLGPFPITGSTFTTTIADLEDPNCTVSVVVDVPPPCSNNCALLSEGPQNILCDDNGSPTDPSDDTYTFTLNISGFNLSDEGWSSSLGVSGAYDAEVTFGPYPISEGGKTIVITDSNDPDCQLTFTVEAPPTCSDQCAIEVQTIEVICLDNGTPSHPEDDLFEVRVLVTPINNSGSGWIASGDVRGDFEEITTLGPYPISEGDRTLIFNSLDFIDCRYVLEVTAPEPCSNQCLIEDVNVLSINCDDNGTPNDGQDDFFTYTVIVNGLNLGESWTASDGTTGAYGVPVMSVAHPVSEGEITIIITDAADDACQFEITVGPPPITIECPEDVFRASVTRNALLLEGELENTDARFAQTDSLCWIPSDNFEAGDHYYDLYTLRFNNDTEEPEVFTFYLFSDIPGNNNLPLGVDGAGALFVGPYYPDDPCCFLQSSDVRADAAEVETLLENPLLDPTGIFSKPYDAIAKFSVLMTPNQDYSLITTTFLNAVEGDYAWLIVSSPGAELEVLNGDVEVESRQEIEVGMELTFFDRQFVLNNPESTDVLGYPTVDPYCGVDSITFDDRLTDLGECNDLTINRKFKVYGYGQSTALDSCEQELTLRKPGLDDLILPPEAILYTCDAEYDTLSNGNPAPSAAGFPLVLTQTGYTELTESFNYNLTIAYKDNVVNVPGDFTQTFSRDWTITDICNDTLLRYSQLIKIGGFTEPIVECPVSNHYCPILEGNIMLFPLDPFECTATVEAPLPDIINTCGERPWMVRTEILQVVGPDTLTLATFEPGEDRIISDLVPADYLFRYTVFDEEGHVVEKICVFRVADTQEPSAICRSDLEVALNGDGSQTVSVEEINQGSYDNCAIENVQIRRVYNYDPVSCEPLETPIFSEWGGSVMFGCCDLGLQVTVEMRVVDIYGNENLCWLDIPVSGEQVPSLSGLESRTVNCSDLPDDFDARDSLQLQAVFGLPQVSASCPVQVVELSPEVQLTECGSGTIDRRFRIARASGLLLDELYTQRIIIEEYSEYEIGFPADAITNCVDWADTLILRKTACDSLVVTYDDEFLDPLADECYRIARTYQVISYCEWDGLSEAVVISRDEDCNNVDGEQRTWVLKRPAEAFVDADRNENNANPTAGTKDPACDGVTNEAGNWRSVLSTGYWQYTQEISVYDESAPAITFTEPDPICTTDQFCTATVTYPFTVDDACVIETLAELRIELDAGADGTIDGDLTNTGILSGSYPDFVIVGDFPIGSHLLVVTATDQCSNTAVAEMPFTVVDCYVSTPICEAGVIVDLQLLEPGTDIDGDGTEDAAGVTVSATSLVSYDPTECSEPLRLSLNRVGELPDIERTSIAYTCNDRYTDSLEVYLWDSAFNPYRLQPDTLTLGGPNYLSCKLQIRIEDPESICPDCEGNPVVGGTVSTENGLILPEIEIAIGGNAMLPMTVDDNGGYRINDLSPGEGYVITPHWDEGHRNGVSTLDLLLARAHVLGVRPLDSPYKMIAADVNNSGSLTAHDLLELRKVILGESDRFHENTSWRFVDGHYAFPDKLNPWLESFPESVVIQSLVGCLEDLDFAAIKIGDLDGSAKADAGHFSGHRGGGNFVQLRTRDQWLEPGASMIWPVELADPAAVLGFQFTLSFDPELLTVEQFVPHLVRRDQVGMRYSSEGAVTLSWNREAEDTPEGSPVIAFGLKIKAKSRIRLSEVLHLNSRITPAEAYRSLEESQGLVLEFAGTAPTVAQLKLRQNRPNPFSDHTIIGFDLPAAGMAEVRIMDVSGRIVWRRKGDFSSGYHEWLVSAEELPAGGVFYYTLQTQDGTLSRKMIVL